MTRPIRILELRSVRGTGGGPEKTILSGAARTDPDRFAVTVCYMRDARDDVFGIDQTAAGLRIDYVEIREKHSFDPGAWTQLRRLVRDKQIDIVHAHEYKTDLLAWLLARAEPITPMATVHGWTGHSSRERWVYYPADKRVLSRLPRLIAVSGDIRNELIRHGAPPDRVTTILNGIDPQTFRRIPARSPQVRAELGFGDGDFVIGAVGRLEPQKRFDRLIDAFARLVPQHPSLRLIIVGDGSLRGALDQQIAALGLRDRCTLVGHRADIADVHHALDLFVQSSDYEGTPNAVLEAMALETPIVATSAGGTAEVARPDVDALIVEADRTELLADAIAAAIADPGAARERTARARQRVETVLSFEARMRALESIYVELFTARHPRPAATAAMRA